jgi:hypothetical protein
MIWHPVTLKNKATSCGVSVSHITRTGAKMKIRAISLAMVFATCCTVAGQDKKTPQASPSARARKQSPLIMIDMPNSAAKVGSAISVRMVTKNNSHDPISVGWGVG